MIKQPFLQRPRAGTRLANNQANHNEYPPMALSQRLTPAPDSIRPRVLIVDDCDGTRAVVAQMLGEDFEPVVVCNGIQAWERIEADSAIAALITDIEMPGLNGFELIARIRQSAEARVRSMPVIAITGAVDGETRRRAFVSGATGMVTKPIDRHQLSALAHAYIRPAASAASPETTVKPETSVELDSIDMAPLEIPARQEAAPGVAIPAELLSIDAALHAIEQGKGELLLPFLSHLEQRLRPLLEPRPAAH
jgi:CheY-like chemotaxis protein